MQIQQMIDSAKLFSEVRFEGELDLELPKSSCFYVGKNFSKSLVTITKPNITLDFSDAVVRTHITDPLDTGFKHGKKCGNKESEIICIYEFPRDKTSNCRYI